MCAQESQTSKDAYIRHDGSDWVLGTSVVEQRVRLAEGRFSLVSFRSKVSGREYQDASNPTEEIRFFVDDHDVADGNWRWSARGQSIELGKQGELQLDVQLDASGLLLTKHFVIYPGTSVVREWMTITNSSDSSVRISNVDFMHARVLKSHTQGLQFNYITGGGNYNGSQLLKTESVTATYQRTLDSNGGIQPGNYSSFLPLAFLHDEKANEGLAVGWDYLGHWRFDVDSQADPSLSISLALAGFVKDIAPHERIETPKAFNATFSGGIDELGNQLLDWQYEYLWEFTNPDYFAKTRWAVDWPEPWVGDGGTPSADNWGRRLALDLRYVDLLRETGTDILWDDAGWYDKWGTWNGPDWKRTNDYLKKHDMKWVLWYPTFLATKMSKVGQQHPEWLIPGQDTLEQSISATGDWQNRLLDQSISDWGDYQWRYDIAPAASANDTDALAADQNFRKVLERFKTNHPQSGIDACDGGGRWISYDIARLADSGEYTDGGVGPYSSYYTSLLVSPDKLHNVVDFDHTYYNAASDRTHLTMDPTWYRDPGDGPDVESIRKDWEIYHYLAAQGVVGRWSHVFRPRIEHDDAVWYFQRMNREGSKGAIFIKHAKRGSTYYVTSRLLKKSPHDRDKDKYRGDAGAMNVVTTTSAAHLDTGIYEDPFDGGYGFYGVPGEVFGPLNVKYEAQSSEQSFVTKIDKVGAERQASDRFFGMAIQVDQPMTITELGQFDPGANAGTYTLSLVRAEDGVVLATAELDMSKSNPDAMGFKYARLAKAVQLDVAASPVVIYPRGLIAAEKYDVTGSASHLHLQETGARLMADGIRLDGVLPGEIIFFNLPRYPGSGTDHTPPTSPSHVQKRSASNLGIEGVEISWSPATDDNWISYYEVRKDGKLIAKAAKGTFFFDHSAGARSGIDLSYDVVAVDGDGNRSASVSAEQIVGEPPTYEALGGFAPAQGINHWAYEEMLEDGSYRELVWDKGGYEGRWAGSGLGRIGRIWMQPSANYDLSRTFIVPSPGSVDTHGVIRKDPSADNQASCLVRILKNSDQVWPAEGWAEVSSHYDDPISYKLLDLKVSAGDKIRFVVKHNGSNRADPIVWDPIIVMKDSKPTERRHPASH